MDKSHKANKCPVECQKGPIRLDEQFQSGFRRQPEMTMEDIRDNELRRSGQTLTLHEPKI